MEVYGRLSMWVSRLARRWLEKAMGVHNNVVYIVVMCLGSINIVSYRMSRMVTMLASCRQVTMMTRHLVMLSTMPRVIEQLGATIIRHQLH